LSPIYCGYSQQKK
ncbi:pentachlorophenol 4-monooxygenase domain protein, partial [Chlamydia psittaci 84-8471/1]